MSAPDAVDGSSTGTRMPWMWALFRARRQLPAEVVEGKGLTQGKQPTGGRGSDPEPKLPRRSECCCASSAEHVKTAPRQTFDPREEPGALAAHAGICAGALSNERPLYVADCLANEHIC